MINVKLIENDIKKRLDELGYELYSLKSFNDRNGQILEVVVDREESIDLDDIVKVSDNISSLLDELITDDSPYTLDVSSLGAEKPISLEKLDKYQGKYVNVHLSHPYKGMNVLEGDLIEIDNEKVVITYKEKTRTIKAEVKRNDIDKARLAIKF